MLLLYMQQRFSRKQIAQILRFPKFMAQKRLYQILNKAVNIWVESDDSLAAKLHYILNLPFGAGFLYQQMRIQKEGATRPTKKREFGGLILMPE